MDPFTIWLKPRRVVYLAVDTWAATESLMQGLEWLGFSTKSFSLQDLKWVKLRSTQTNSQWKFVGTFRRVPDRSCFPNITPYCLIQPLYNLYISGIRYDMCVLYISRVLSEGYPTFPFDNSHGVCKFINIIYTFLKINGRNMSSWKFGLDHFPFQMGDL